jgi:hypothetical protein
MAVAFEFDPSNLHIFEWQSRHRHFSHAQFPATSAMNASSVR